jgi:hypothetical protein
VNPHEAPSGGDALRFYETVAICLPRPYAWIPGWHDGLDHRGKRLGPAEQGLERIDIEAVPLMHFLDEGTDILAPGIGLGTQVRAEQDQQGEQ